MINLNFLYQVLLSGGKKKSLDNYQRQSIESDGVRRESIVDYTNERIVTSREATMQEHIKVIEHKKIGEKGIQDFTYGAFTGIFYFFYFFNEMEHQKMATTKNLTIINLANFYLQNTYVGLLLQI